jgi:RimJ/RimL family protein N-acetyltransferase
MTDKIITNRLVLRPPVDADAAIVMEGLNDYSVVKWLARVPYPFHERDLKLRNSDGSSRWPGLAAIDHDGDMIGMVSGMPHVGFWLLRRAWGKGFATEAARAMVNLVFARKDVEHVLSGYFDGNRASERVLEKTGFRQVSKDMHWCEARKKELPHHNMRLDRQDWEAARC